MSKMIKFKGERTGTAYSALSGLMQVGAAHQSVEKRAVGDTVVETTRYVGNKEIATVSLNKRLNILRIFFR